MNDALTSLNDIQRTLDGVREGRRTRERSGGELESERVAGCVRGRRTSKETRGGDAAAGVCGSARYRLEALAQRAAAHDGSYGERKRRDHRGREVERTSVPSDNADALCATMRALASSQRERERE